MNSLKKFIYERITDTSYNSPDSIHVNNYDENGNKILKCRKKIIKLDWRDNNSYAFIYSVKLNSFLFSKESDSHADIFYYTNNVLKNFDNLYDIKNNGRTIYDLRYIKGDKSYKSYEKWKTLNQFAKRFKLGRIWIFNKILYITWWDELSSEQFIKYNDALINYIEDNKENFDEFNKIYCMHNNGDLLEYDKNNKNISQQSKNRKEILQIQQAIHLATQKEKNNFFKEFKKHRDEANQKIYNITKSKTEAEYRSIRYQGDSLIDNEKNRINE